MIDRYSRPEIKKLWETESKFKYMLDVELAVCRVQNKLGKIPDDSLKGIEENASFSVERIDEIEIEDFGKSSLTQRETKAPRNEKKVLDRNKFMILKQVISGLHNDNREEVKHRAVHGPSNKYSLLTPKGE